MNNREAVKYFKSKIHPRDAELTLGGTGPNGALQTWVLKELGIDYLNNLNNINLISGSVFSYIIFLALSENQLFDKNCFINFDQHNRRQHGASFFRTCQHLLKGKVMKQGIFDNHCLGDSVLLVFNKELVDRTLSELPSNIHFFFYCNHRQEVIELSSSSEEFSDLTLRQLARASASVVSVHGYFRYKDYLFSDPMYSPAFKSLRRRLFSSQNQHLYVNYKKEGQSGNILFVKHDESRNPNIMLFKDFIKFCLNMPNPSVNQTHKAILDEFSYA